MTRHVLVGSGPASLAAAQEIRGLDPSAEITMVGREAEGYYSRPGLAYHLATEIPERALFPFAARDFARLNVTFVQGRAVGVDEPKRLVILEDGRELPYDRLLIATGSEAIPLGVPGADLDGVVKLDDLRDARDLIARSRRHRTAVVVGGGITALEIAEGLCARKVDVHYFMRKDRYWSNVLSEPESRIVEDGLRSRGVDVHYFTELAAVLGRGSRVAGVETAAGERIPCDLVAVAIGVLPEMSFARAAGVAVGRGVLVDGYLRSSSPDIFAAGDAAEVASANGGPRTIEVLWNSAVMKGRVAGHNMVRGPELAYDPGVPLNVTRLAGFRITIIGSVGSGNDADLHGIVRGDSETWRRMGAARAVEWEDRDTHLRLALTGTTIGGAIVMGDQSLSFPLQELITARADIGEAAARLAMPSAEVPALIRQARETWRDRVPAKS